MLVRIGECMVVGGAKRVLSASITESVVKSHDLSEIMEF
jgi:hypothetical protein